MVIRLLLLFFYPIFCLCHANKYIYELQNTFQTSSPEDFAMIGGSDRWEDFMTRTPAAWTYYGLWITWDRVISAIWAAVVAAAAAALAAGISNLYG